MVDIEEGKDEKKERDSMCPSIIMSEYDKKEEISNKSNIVFKPHYVGNMILLWGKKDTTFPFQCLIGPHWLCMLVTYTLIIVPTYFFLVDVAWDLHPIAFAIGCISFTILFVSFTWTAATDPGIVWIENQAVQEDDTIIKQEEEKKQEKEQQKEEKKIINNNNNNNNNNEEKKIELTDSKNNLNNEIKENKENSNNNEIKETNQNENKSDDKENKLEEGENKNKLLTIDEILKDEEEEEALKIRREKRKKQYRYRECNQCEILKPRNAMHCYMCNICVNDLDHHCPWTGKCIGKKNIKGFYIFVTSLWIHITFVVLISIVGAVRHQFE